jgi:hypothetical protein
LACFIHNGRHYEVIFEIAQRWRESVKDGDSTFKRPSRDIRKLIIRRHEQHKEDLAKRALKPKPTQSPLTPSTVNHIYVNQQQPQEQQVYQPPPPIVPTVRQISPVPPELNTASNWEKFWDGIKLTYSDWSSNLDRARVGLETDCWNLRMLFNSSDELLSQVVKQGGLRIVILEELTKFVDLYKQQRRQRQQSNPGLRAGPSSVTSITSNSSSSPYYSSRSNSDAGD